MDDYRSEHLRRMIRDIQRQSVAHFAYFQRIRETFVFPQMTAHIANLPASSAMRTLSADLSRNLANVQKTILPDLQRAINNAEQFRGMYRRIAEAARTARDRTFPSNWSGFGYQNVASIISLMKETGWSLVWVPRQEIIRELLRAEADARDEVLIGSATEIIEDLEAALGEVHHADLIDLRDHLNSAVAAFRAGFHPPAQALATASFTTILHVHLGLKRFGAVRDEFGKLDPMQVTITAFKIAAIYGAAARAIDTYMGEDDEPIPTRFNRHASTHRVSPVQYTTANALASLLLATSLLRELDLLLRLQFPEDESDDES